MKTEKVRKQPLGDISEKSVVENVGGYQIIECYGDLQQEYDALRSQVGVLDYSANGKIKITGNDPIAFLNPLISIDIEFMDIERTNFALILNEEAQVIDLITFYHQEDYIWIETSPDKRKDVYEWLVEKNTDQNVEIEDVTENYAVVGFEGPYAWKVGQTFLDFDISSLPFQSFVETTWEGEEILFARTGVTGEYGYKLLIDATAGSKLWQYVLEQKGEEYVVHPVGTLALEITMLEVRQPNIVYETKDLNVFEACLEWLIHFDKEDYTANHALQTIREKGVDRRIVGFCFDTDETLEEGDTIFVEEVEVGKVVQVVPSFNLGKKLALGVIENTFAVSGLTLQALHHKTDKQVTIQTISSPYVIPKSWGIKII